MGQCQLKDLVSFLPLGKNIKIFKPCWWWSYLRFEDSGVKHQIYGNKESDLYEVIMEDASPKIYDMDNLRLAHKNAKKDKKFWIERQQWLTPNEDLLFKLG